MKKKDFLNLWLRLKHEAAGAKEKPRRILKWIKWLFVAFVVGCTAIGVIVLLMVLPNLPDIDNIHNLVAAQSSAIYDREGNLLYTIHGEENRESIALADVPQYAIDAVLAIEDDRFYEHGGVDFLAVMKAVCHEVHICSTPRGGSTITQQFIKNAFLSSERTYTRKLKEIIMALQLESRFTKDEILEMYLNRIPYGSSVYGIERAAKAFYGEPAKELTLAEGAVLAAIPKAPTYFSPYGDYKYAAINVGAEEIVKMNIRSEQDLVDINPDFISKGLLGKTYYFGACEEEGGDGAGGEVIEEGGPSGECYSIYVKGRVDYVLGRMLELGYITQDQYDQGAEEAKTLEFIPFVEEIEAPHFVMYVRQILEEKYGKEQIEKGGLKITTTIDPRLQEAAEESVAAYAEKNLTNYKATNASLVAIDPNNGQILAMVGSVDYWNDEIDGKVNVALRPRLPGSSFKPISYAAAFLQGYAPSTVLYDVRTKFGGWYEPENYDGEYRGPVTMRQALAHSLNIPAVKAGSLAGIPNVLDLARKMGIQLNQPDDWYGLSLSLGAGEARLLDMVSAYSIFANGGYKMDSVAVLKVEDHNGNILEEYQSPQNRTLILDPQVAYLINNVLSDVEARPEGWWRQRLSIPGQVNGAKTGTSNKERGEINIPLDTWTLGYTKRIAAGVWAGNNDGTPLSFKASGLDAAGGIWHDFMAEATKDFPREEFERPEGIKWVRISEKTGKLPSEHTPENAIKTGVFASFSVPRDYDTSYRLVKIDKVSGKLATEYTPEAAIEERPYFEHHSILPDNDNWESAVRQWAKENDQDEPIPTEYDDVHTPETMNMKPEIVITSPKNLSTVSAPFIGVWPKIDSPAGVVKVEYYWDGELYDTAGQAPFKGSLQISARDNKKGSEHTIKAIVYDTWYRSSQSSINVKIGDDEVSPIIDFSYPGDGARLDAGASMATQVQASDPNGDILKIEFYMDGDLKEIVRQPPYLWQFTVPDELGPHTIRAVAYDHAKNSASASITITSKTSEAALQGGASRILEPYRNESFSEGRRVLVKAYLSNDDRKQLKELVISAKKKGEKSIEIAKAIGDTGVGGAYIYTFIWDSAPAGTYELQMKVVLQDEKIRFSQRVPIVVR
ncbi:penicillin-binding protein [Candidatus Peregrinibacteria bacterium]|nr:penicillin-binding protein [Candidatus Peregrinibacteria bacterium]